MGLGLSLAAKPRVPLGVDILYRFWNAMLISYQRISVRSARYCTVTVQLYSNCAAATTDIRSADRKRSHTEQRRAGRQQQKSGEGDVS